MDFSRWVAGIEATILGGLLAAVVAYNFTSIRSLGDVINGLQQVIISRDEAMEREISTLREQLGNLRNCP